MILEDRTWKSWQTSLPCNAQRYLRICRLEPDGWSTDCIDQPSAWTPNTTNLRKTTKGILEWKCQFSLQSSIHFFPSQFWEFGVTLSWWLCLLWSPVCLTMYYFFEGKKNWMLLITRGNWVGLPSAKFNGQRLSSQLPSNTVALRHITSWWRIFLLSEYPGVSARFAD